MEDLIMVSVLRRPDDLSKYLLRSGFAQREQDASLVMKSGFYYLGRKKVQKEIVAGYLAHLRLPVIEMRGNECYSLPPRMNAIRWETELRKVSPDSKVLYFDGFNRQYDDAYQRTAHFFFEGAMIVRELTKIVADLDSAFLSRRGSTTDIGYVLESMKR